MNSYKHLSNKGKDIVRNATYTSIIVNSLNMMFDYKNMDDINTIRFENILLTNGSASFEKWNDKLVPCYVSVGGQKLPDDNYEKIITMYANHENAFEHDSSYPVCFNTGDRQPALNILRFADMLSEVDLSMVFNLQRSRLAPIPIAKNRALREQIKNIYDSIKNGNWEVISADWDKDLFTETGNSIEMINLNDPKSIEYMNYLSELHDNLTRRLYTMYGMAVNETSKHAQVNKEETTARDGVSWLIPDNMLRERQKFLKTWNDMYGTNFSVDYSDLFKKEREIYDYKGGELNETGNINGTDNDSNKSDLNKSDNTNEQ